MSRNSVQMARQKFAPVKQEFIAFKGGVDLETPPLFAASGSIRSSQNYECDVLGGYITSKGYERHDGRPKPSDAAYAIINTTITGSFAAGNTITGVTSGATAVVVAVVTSGTPDYLVITKIVGTFVSGEVLNVAAAPQGTTSSAATVDGASSPLLHAQYKNLAADAYRSDIAAIPGTGSVLGIVRFNGVNYGFRNNAGGTEAKIYKSSAGGWVAVPTGSEVSFTGGNSSVGEGDTLTQGGVTATIKRLIVLSGTSPNLVGRLVIHTVAGGNFAAGAATSSGGGALTLSGAQTAIAILPGGSYEFIVQSFGGSLGSRRIYGVDAVNRGFEFDGTDYSYTPISTGMTGDMPTHLIGHRNHLFYSFVNGSIQNSGPGTPYVWSAILGAAEIALGDVPTGFMTQPGSETSGALAIFTRNRSHVLYGTGNSTWVLVPYREELGAYAKTLQDIGFTIFLDDRGVTDFQQTQVYGNFSHASYTQRIKTWLNVQRTKAISSCISRDRSQYRLFFSDQYALYMTFIGKKVVGMSQMFFAHQAKCTWTSEESDGTETIFFGSTNGMVYQMERGTSLDGDAIESYLMIAYDFIKSPRILKHFKQSMIEATGTGYAGFQFGYVLGYSDTNINQPIDTQQTVSFSSVYWDALGAVWDALFWDGTTLSGKDVDMGGTAENISLIFRGSSDYDAPVRFSGAIINYQTRRVIR